MLEITGKYTTAKVMIDNVEESCLAQIHHFVNHPSFTNPVAIMPDTHAGKGSVIGFTMPLSSTVIPNVIGVDIGCGMLSLNVGKAFTMSLEQVDHKIRQRIPFGMIVHDKSIIQMEKEFPWRQATVLAQKLALAYREKFGTALNPPNYDMNWFMAKGDAIRAGGVRRFINSLGTLGGGNHFVEIGVSNPVSHGPGDYWITIHTGSRNFGKCICEYWQGKAAKAFSKEGKEDINRKIAQLKTEERDGKLLFKKIKELKAQKKKPGIDMKGCEWLEGDDASSYLFDMVFSQVYAEVNRRLIGEIFCDVVGVAPMDSIETIHNFIDFRDFIIRKGAIRSYAGERMILPFNMRDGILICEGKSNPEWNFSAPHGAGRTMSRGQAKKQLDLAEFKNQMAGIYSTSIGTGTLDEAPDAYKPAQLIEEAIRPTAAIIGRIKPIHNMKDSKGEDD
jgi:tRNA-splicing ligase RtcB (3'-phosphate/5'-hydroxy nucleic acid ligase)